MTSVENNNNPPVPAQENPENSETFALKPISISVSSKNEKIKIRLKILKINKSLPPSVRFEVRGHSASDELRLSDGRQHQSTRSNRLRHFAGQIPPHFLFQKIHSPIQN